MTPAKPRGTFSLSCYILVLCFLCRESLPCAQDQEPFCVVSVCLSRATPRHPRGRPQTRTATLLSQALGAPPWRTTPSSRPGSPAVLALPTEEGPPLPLLQPDQPSRSGLPLPPVFPVVCSGTPEPLSCQSSPPPSSTLPQNPKLPLPPREMCIETSRGTSGLPQQSSRPSLVPEGPSGPVQWLSELASIVQHCPGLAGELCRTQVIDLIQSLVMSPFRTPLALELINKLLEVTNYTGLGLLVAQAMQGLHGTKQAAREEDGSGCLSQIHWVQPSLKSEDSPSQVHYWDDIEEFTGNLSQFPITLPDSLPLPLEPSLSPRPLCQPHSKSLSLLRSQPPTPPSPSQLQNPLEIPNPSQSAFQSEGSQAFPEDN